MKYLFSLAALLISQQSLAQQACYPREMFAAGLAQSYNEFPLFDAIMNIDGSTVPVTLYASLGGTWTMVTVPNANIVCPIHAGSGFDLPQMHSRKRPPA